MYRSYFCCPFGQIIVLTSCLILAGTGFFAHASSRLGINLAGDWLYADAIHQARAQWTVPSDPWGSTYATVDGQGWPTQDATLVVWEGRAYNNGTYTLVFQGKATVSTFDAGPMLPRNADGSTGVYDASTNTTTATMVVTDAQPENFALTLTHTQRTAASAVGTGFTDLHLYRPVNRGSSISYHRNDLFTRQTLALVKKFAVVRFMDQFGVIGSTTTDWAQRNPPTAWNYSPMPYELAVQLCNQAGVDFYLNVPLEANADYITKLAQLIRYGSDGINPYTSPQARPIWAGLKPGLHVYLEDSNELWNFGQPQAGQNLALVQADQGANNAEWQALNYDGTGSGNIYYAAWRRVALGIKTISDGFRAVYGDAAMPPNANATVRPLLEFQSGAGQETAAQQLTFLDDYYNNNDGVAHVAMPHPVNYFLWGGGGATYYTSNNDFASTVDGLFASGIPCTGINSTQPYQLATEADTNWMRAYGLKRVAYEGGWSVYNGTNGYETIEGSPADKAKDDPRAETAEEKAETIFEQAGGDLNIFYTSSSFAHNYVWGMTAKIFNLNTPLYQAVDAIDTRTTPAAATHGVPVSATRATVLTPRNVQTTDYVDGGTLVFGLHSQGEIIFLPLVTTPGPYRVYLKVGDSRTGESLRVLVDGAPLGRVVPVPVTFAPNADPVYRELLVGTVNWTPGQHGLLIRGLPSTTAGYQGYSGSIPEVVLRPVKT